jgi:predicted MFS family arabinose efflux permease
MNMNQRGENWDASYEWKVILLLALGFGLVGLDRWIITPVFPYMMRDLHLSYLDLGSAVGALAIVWGLSAVWTGRLADLIGRRKVAIPALIIFSLASALTGMTTGITALILVRALMGATEGAYLPACTAATNEAAAPARRGRDLGFVLCAFPLLGLGLGPIIATQLLKIVPSWRWVFFLVAVPGLILAAFLYRVLRDPGQQTRNVQVGTWAKVIRSRNILLATGAMICAMSCIFVLGAMVPSYLVDYLKFSPGRMGVVMSALGFGGCVGNFLMPSVSDYLGRRTTLIGAAAMATLAALLLTRVGPDFLPLYLILFTVSLFSFGIMATAAGPIAIEAVTPELAASAVGVVTGTGEIFGGGIAPMIAGFVADRFGIQHVLYIGFVGCSCAIVIGLLLVETAPRFVVAHADSSV